MNKSLIIVGGIVVLVLLAGVYIYSTQQRDQQKTETVLSPQNQSETSTATMENFSTPVKSAHYEDNTPAHGSVLAAPPLNIVIDFNFDLAKGSDILIKKDGMEYGVGVTTIDQNKLAMRKEVNQQAPDGLYTVNYKACWSDGSCHDGSFQFKIDRSKSKEFIDMIGKKEVTIMMKNFAFEPKMLKVSKGTKVTWVNQDSVVHTVNTDSHPQHTYFLSQNSRDLKKGGSFSVVFEKPGVYPYHCTPHADSMTGQIVVE